MVYIITGASSGIGLATAEALANIGHTVIAVARRKNELEQLQSRCGDDVYIVATDLSTDAGIASLIAALQSFAHIDGLVHAAASLVNPVDYNQLDTEKLVSDTHIHVAVPIALNKALADKLIGSRIVYIDSYSASSLRVGWSGYSIVKAAAQMAACAAQEEFKQASVIRIFPGAVRTPLVETVLNWPENSPVVDTFSEAEAAGKVSEPKKIGEYIAGILTRATNVQLKEREFWDYNRDEDRLY